MTDKKQSVKNYKNNVFNVAVIAQTKTLASFSFSDLVVSCYFVLYYRKYLWDGQIVEKI